MQKVWKFELRPGEVTLALPEDAQPLTVQMQGDRPQMWVLVNPLAARVPRTFRVAGTGHDLPGTPLLYVGSFQMPSEALGMLVWHVFEQP